MDADALLDLLRRFQAGFVRATADIDILLPSSYDSLQEHVRTLQVDDVAIRTLDIEGLLKTKTEYCAKDRIDREALLEIKTRLQRP